MLSSEKPDEVENKTETLDPNVDEDYPEVILNSGRILQPENEDVLYNWDGIKIQKELCCIGASDNSLRKAKGGRQWSDE